MDDLFIVYECQAREGEDMFVDACWAPVGYGKGVSKEKARDWVLALAGMGKTATMRPFESAVVRDNELVRLVSQAELWPSLY